MHGICHADASPLSWDSTSSRESEGTEGTEKIKDVIASRLDEQEATRLLQHLENGDEDWGDDRLEALVYQQMHDFSTVDHGDVQVTQSEDTSFPEPIQKEAPAAAEHYFWCMLGARGGTWLAAVRPCAIPIAPKQGAPTADHANTITAESQHVPAQAPAEFHSPAQSPRHRDVTRQGSPRASRHRDVTGEDSWQYARAAGTQLGGV